MPVKTYCDKCRGIRPFPHDCPFVGGTRRISTVTPGKGKKYPWYLGLLIAGLAGIGAAALMPFIKGLIVAWFR